MTNHYHEYEETITLPSKYPEMDTVSHDEFSQWFLACFEDKRFEEILVAGSVTQIQQTLKTHTYSRKSSCTNVKPS